MVSKIRNAYSESTYFHENWKPIKNLYLSLFEENLYLSNINVIKIMAQWLKIDVNYVNSSDLPNLDNKTSDERLIEIISQLNGKVYYSGTGAQEYQEEKNFNQKNIKLLYSNFKITKYDQKNSNFIGCLSILDALFYLGRKNIINLLP